MSASGLGPFDLKTSVGRDIYKVWRVNHVKGIRYFMGITIWNFVVDTLFHIHIKRKCGNYHHITARCNCMDW